MILPDRLLGVIALNPPLGPGTPTRRHSEVAAKVLGCDTYKIANLHGSPTRDLGELQDLATTADGWMEARALLSALIGKADHIVAAWGISEPTGLARGHYRDQIAWIYSELDKSEHDLVWMVGGRTRHPSRWHQFVSDRHSRTTGGTFEERLRQVLTAHWVGTNAGQDSGL